MPVFAKLVLKAGLSVADWQETRQKLHSKIYIDVEQNDVWGSDILHTYLNLMSLFYLDKIIFTYITGLEINFCSY